MSKKLASPFFQEGGKEGAFLFRSHENYVTKQRVNGATKENHQGQYSRRDWHKTTFLKLCQFVKCSLNILF
jgi:hypothetical protein